MVIRDTRSVCAQCLTEVPARVEVDGELVYLRKACPQHGESECLLSRHAWYYAALDNYYFSVMGAAGRQRDYLVRLTERCNLHCPICLASATRKGGEDLAAERLYEWLNTRRGERLKIDLMAAEPTLRTDLFDLIGELKRRGHIVALHTNGLRLTNPDYCQKLRAAGVDEVHLQMDGFDDEAYRKIRGLKLAAAKRRVLANLQAAEVATDLVMVIMPRTNESEISLVLDYCRRHHFVRELFFLGTRALGYHKDSQDLLMPDQVIDLVEEASGGLCRRLSVFRFQKLYFALLALLGVRKCLYVQHYLLFRGDQDEWVPVDTLFDWERVERILDELPSVKGWRRLPWAARLSAAMLSRNLWRYLPALLGLLLYLKCGWNLSRLSRRVLLVGYITACDPHNVDQAVAAHCGKGELSVDVGCCDSSADANLARERRWRVASTPAALNRTFAPSEPGPPGG